jgi:hypothetical protein
VTLRTLAAVIVDIKALGGALKGMWRDVVAVMLAEIEGGEEGLSASTEGTFSSLAYNESYH